MLIKYFFVGLLDILIERINTVLDGKTRASSAHLKKRQPAVIKVVVVSVAALWLLAVGLNAAAPAIASIGGAVGSNDLLSLMGVLLCAVLILLAAKFSMFALNAVSTITKRGREICQQNRERVKLVLPSIPY